MQVKLTWWQEFVLWVEDERTQLGMDLATYYGLCAMMGAINSLAYWRCLSVWLH